MNQPMAWLRRLSTSGYGGREARRRSMSQPMSSSKRYLSASEAAAELGISQATLYAYVSRGLIHSEPGNGRSRARRYRREEIARLKERQAQRRDPARAAATALSWGSAVLESGIT